MNTDINIIYFVLSLSVLVVRELLLQRERRRGWSYRRNDVVARGAVESAMWRGRLRLRFDRKLFVLRMRRKLRDLVVVLRYNLELWLERRARCRAMEQEQSRRLRKLGGSRAVKHV